MVGSTPVLVLEEAPEKPVIVKEEAAPKPKAARPKAPDENTSTESANE